MNRQLFTGGLVFDGTGASVFPGEVLVEGRRIAAVARGHGALPTEHCDVVAIDGCTIMPGLVEAHGHISYSNMADLRELGTLPPEENVLLTLKNGEVMLDHGFTSVYSAASAKVRTEVVVRNAINSGQFVGPRLRAASPEITSTGGLGDARQLHRAEESSFGLVVDGADDLRRTVRMLCREGVDTIKLNISGDNLAKPGMSRRVTYTEQEIAAVAEEAASRGVWLASHARSDESVRASLRHGFRVIYHADFIGGETFDLLEKVKDEIFVGPAIGFTYASAHEAHGYISEQYAAVAELYDVLESARDIYGELRRRGVRVLPGGDYGFAWNPIGNDARDLEHFVSLLGFSPAEALMAATKWGGELMDIKIGLLQPEFLADLIVVRGDPTRDIRLLQHRSNIAVVMKDGSYFRNDIGAPS